MIITLTANPSLDRTVTLGAPLQRGDVQRAQQATVEPGGKGINVARVLHNAGHPVRAVLPADAIDPILRGLDALDLPYRTVRLGAAVRTNIALTEPDGTTTKVNETGPELTAETVEALAQLLVLESERADWVVLSGSLPPGVPLDWYAQLVPALRPWGCRIAVDTSDAPLLALAAEFSTAAPDLIKPNAAELAQLTGADPDELEAGAAAGDPRRSVEAARAVVGAGVGAVLVTLGAAGAVLVTEAGAWWGSPPPITVRSTVGAGDSSLAGYILAQSRGLAEPDRLRQAIAHGSAAAALAGTQLPRPDQLNASAVHITELA